MIFKIIGVLVLIVVGIVGFAATRPDDFKIQRAAQMKAPPDRILEQISDFRKWGAWSPWEKIDPNLKRTYEGPEKGKGAVYGWEGNSEVGKGRMEILEVVPGSKVVIKLDFIAPFEAHNITEFSTTAKGDQTELVWTMSGKNPLMSKIFDLLMNMDKMVGKDFEKGLAQLKAVVESGK